MGGTIALDRPQKFRALNVISTYKDILFYGDSRDRLYLKKSSQFMTELMKRKLQFLYLTFGVDNLI